MNIGYKGAQVIHLGINLLMVGLCWWYHNVILGVLFLPGLVFTVVALLSPAPEQRVHKLQEQGIYPLGQATDEDVRRVVEAGHKILAIRLYREVHGASLKEAADAVRGMR